MRHYRRTLEDVHNGVPPPFRYKRKERQKTINPYTGRWIVGRKKTFIKEDAKVPPKRDPIKSFLQSKGPRKNYIPRPPLGFRVDRWRRIFRGRLKQARKIVDKLLENEKNTGVPGFDTQSDAVKNRDLTTDEGKAAASLDYCMAVVISPEMPVHERRQHASLVLQYTKQKPTEKKSVDVTMEQWLHSLDDDV